MIPSTKAAQADGSCRDDSVYMCTPGAYCSAGAMATVEHKEQKHTEDFKFLWKWRKYLLLLATLVASVTYAAGLNPPGGVRSEEGGNNARGQHTAGTVEPSGLYPYRVGGAVDPPLPPAYPNRVGDPVLVSTYSSRYTAFFYCNAAAFVASLVVIMFLLEPRISNNSIGLTVLRSAMQLDLLALMAAFAAGSCRDVAATIYVSVLFALVFAFVVIYVCVEMRQADTGRPQDAEEILNLKDRRKFMLLLATFATPLTYAAGLVPPGGFWSQTESGHRAGAPLLHDGLFKIRYDAFFYANASSFVASLAVIVMLTSRTISDRLARSYALLVCVLVELLGLMAAFAAGSCRWFTTTVYVVCLVGVVLLYIVLQMAIAVPAMDMFKTLHDGICNILTCSLCRGNKNTNMQATPAGTANAPQQEENGQGGGGGGEGGGSERTIDIENGEAATQQGGGGGREGGEGGGSERTIDIENGEAAPQQGGEGGGGRGDGGEEGGGSAAEKVEESRALLLLLATLAATVTYQTGLSPPGGVWPDAHDQGNLIHIPGSPILHDMHFKRYMAFYNCNSAAFVASVVIIIIVESKELSSDGEIRRAALKTAMILDLFGLMGAYIAGSCQDTASTIYLCALAGVVFVYAIAMIVAAKLTNQNQQPDEHNQQPTGSESDLRELERKRKFLLQIAILAATVTYQSGLNPPGGFWQVSKAERSLTAGDPVLLDYYGIRYQVFFYCNATGFMASVAVIRLLVNQKLYKDGIRSNALHVCVVVGLLGLMGAYSAGSSRQLRTSIYVFALVAAVVAFLSLQILFFVFANSGNLSEQQWLPQRLKELVKPLSSSPWQTGENKGSKEQQQQGHIEKHKKSKYLMLLGILAASVTYQAGLAPPGGTWGDDDDTASSPSPSPSPASSPSGVAGNPILLDSSPARYQAFFYCNATSFVASIVLIVLLLQHTVKNKKPTTKPRHVPLWSMQTAVVLDLLGLLGAYAAGSCRGWKTSAYVIALVAVVGVFITMYVLVRLLLAKKPELSLVPNCLGSRKQP